LDFYADSVVLLARNEIPVQVYGFYRKNNLKKNEAREVLGPHNLLVGLQPINQSTRKYYVKLTNNLRNMSQTTNET